MQKTITISRDDLNNKKYKNTTIDSFGVLPAINDIQRIAKLLKKLQGKGDTLK